MKKLLSILAVLALMFTLVACSNSKETGKEKDAKGNDAPAEKQENVTLHYANWALGTEEEQNLERLMLKAFQEEHPNIKIEVFEVAGDWNEALSTAASAGEMPDVFSISQLPLALSNDWLLDLTELTAADTDFENVPEVVRQSAKFNDKVVAVPNAQHFLGYFVNKDLFNKANLDYPEMGVSIEDFTKAVKDVTNVNEGTVGLTNPFSIPDWYPAAANPDMGWYTYKDGQYSLDSKEFIAGVNLAKEITTNGYAYEVLTDDQKANFNGEDPTQVWLNGGTGIHWDGSWAISSLTENASFEFDFIGIPGGKTVITNDLLGISKSTKHAEEAYLFAKYMSFGKDGFMKRMEIADKEGKTVNTLPVNTDPEILDEYFSQLNVPGVRKAYDHLDEAILEPVKTVPGYVQSRWEAPTGVKVGDNENANMALMIESFVKGNLKVEDYAAQLNQLANEKSKEAVEALK
ncbi:ABC transporter substrate-binding protein [Lederbergia wuyishanensis]|uniref:Multiple sugar transport system substrate-binding protein n=1 Tax=Lederbergia wuyishanensis TaxID=1347903 RepID=A0ABU0D8E4_9BACI|nr:extracellular solute-binding protein [Lederbergia wuyishanensis]MCJ8009197.1 extracellular solute-binding protein [Lederbergia wuyishanensis]MDQ0344674.1 multiple sugar transport system substrate-binding protein [Lederbergia wuyishanensis]